LCGVAAALVAIPCGVVVVESMRREEVLAVEELVMHENAELFYFPEVTALSRFASPVLAQGRVEASTRDERFGVSVSGACQVRRVTEYCANELVTVEECPPLSGKCKQTQAEETAWRTERGLSAKVRESFHHSALAYESTRSVAATAIVEGNGVTARLDESLLYRLEGDWKHVDFAFEEQEGRTWLSTLFGDRRGSLVTDAQPTLLSWRDVAPAFRKHGFSYVGAGYFYRSADEETRRLMASSFEAWTSRDRETLDGVGAGCDPGDVRIHFEALAPEELSVMAVVTAREEEGPTFDLGDSEDIRGIVKSGILNPDTLLRDKAPPITLKLALARTALLAWAFPAAAILAALVGVDLSGPISRLLMAAALACALLALAWTRAYGLDRAWRDVGLALTLASSLFCFSLTVARPAKSPPGCRAVLALLAKWTGLDPARARAYCHSAAA